MLSYQLNHRRRHHRWNVSGPARISTGGWYARLPSTPAPVIQFRIKITFISHYTQTTD